jgi:hypothetical protein
VAEQVLRYPSLEITIQNFEDAAFGELGDADLLSHSWLMAVVFQ